MFRFKQNFFRRLSGAMQRRRPRTLSRGLETLEGRQLMAVVMIEPHDPHPDHDGCGPHAPPLPSGENFCNTIQAGVDHALAGDDLILAPRTYHESVFIDKSLSMRAGRGRATIVGGGGASVMITPGVGAVGMHNLDLTGSAAGIVADGVGHLDLLDVTSTGNADHALLFTGVGRLSVVGGVYGHNGSDGIVVEGASALEMINVEVLENGGHGLRVVAVDDVRMDGSWMIGNGLAGGVFDAVGDVRLIETSFAENHHDGAVFAAIEGTLEATSGHFDGNGGDGFHVNDADGAVRLTDVHARENEMQGITLLDVKDVIVIRGGEVRGGPPAVGIPGPPAAARCGNPGPAGAPNGINIVGGNAPTQLLGILGASNAKGNGIFIRERGDVTITGPAGATAAFNTNGLSGLVLDTVGAVSLTDVQADSNQLAGGCVLDADQFTDLRGSYQKNKLDGLTVIRTTTDVRLQETNANGNDADANGVGDGVRLSQVGRNVTVIDSGFGVGPTGEIQQTGLDVANVGGAVTLRSPAGRLVANRNTVDGIRIVDVNAAGPNGFAVDAMDGTVTNNGRDGLSVSDGTSVRVWGMTSNLNGRNGSRVVGTTRNVLLQDLNANINGAEGAFVDSTDGTVEVTNTIANTNVGDGIHIRNTGKQIDVIATTANTNGGDGVDVDTANEDVNLRQTRTDLNVGSGIEVSGVKAVGLATDFKITVDDATGNGNGVGVRVYDVERLLVQDSNLTANAVGIQMGIGGPFGQPGPSDDATVKRSDVSRSATNGIQMIRTNDVNLQFVTADENGGHGVFAVDGSTIHATGGSFSGNAAGAGFRLERVGDVSTYGAELVGNANGIWVDQAGFIDLAETVLRANQQGFELRHVARVTANHLSHRGNATDSRMEIVGAGADDAFIFAASPGALVDQVELTVDVRAEQDSLRLAHTRTVDHDGVPADLLQNEIQIVGASHVYLGTGDGHDRLLANDWSDQDDTGLLSLTLAGGAGEDQFALGISRDVLQTVQGDEPTTDPGDRLSLNSDGHAVDDTGQELRVAGYAAIHYAGIESVAAAVDVSAPTVEIITAYPGGIVNDVAFRFSEPVRGFDLSDVRLTRPGTPDVNLLPEDAVLTASDSGMNWTLHGLGNATAARGSYRLEVTSVDAAIADASGNELQSGAKWDWEHVPGDSNGDGRFDSGDLIRVFAEARYRTGEPASYHQGDWNGDGVFDESDLIFALSQGRYQND